MKLANRILADAALARMRDALSDIESVRIELQSALDNTPENFQSGDRYEAREQEAEAFDQATAGLESAISALDDAL